MARLPLVAKRSVRKARAREAQAPRPEERATSSRGFWLGALVSAAVLVPLAVVAVLLLSGGEEEPEASGSNTEQIEEGAEELSQQFAERDKQQIEELTARTRSMVDELAPVLAGLGRTLPPGSERTGPVAAPADVEEWRGIVLEADEYFAETVSGETTTNVARNGFANAVDALLESVETYGLAVEQPAARAALLERARAQRDLAARTWSTASIQLDYINIEAGYGHQHVVFPPSSGEAAAPPDSLPEGTDAEPEGDR